MVSSHADWLAVRDLESRLRRAIWTRRTEDIKSILDALGRQLESMLD